MLQANLKNGKTIVPALLSKEKLISLKHQRKTYYCPTCKEKVILRAGTKVTPHFSHFKNSNCPTGKGGEGPYHERGKLDLYRWLVRQGIEVELESLIPTINQRPDLFLKVNEHQIAIEYQCSRIQIDRIIERTKGYQQAGIHVIWILGERLLKRKGRNTLAIDSFSQLLMHQFSSSYPLSLFYYCPLTSMIIKFQDIIFIQQRKAFGKLTIRSLNKLTFPNLLASNFVSKESLIFTWKREIERFRTRQRRRVFGDELKWQKWLYQNGLHVDQLSSLAYLPIRNGYRMKLPPWNWQSRILYGIISPKRLGSTITHEECRRIVQHAMIPTHQFPLLTSSSEPIHDYLTLLSSLEILEQIDETTFVKRQSIPIHQQIEDAFQEDTYLLENLISKKQS